MIVLLISKLDIQLNLNQHDCECFWLVCIYWNRKAPWLRLRICDRKSYYEG